MLGRVRYSGKSHAVLRGTFGSICAGFGLRFCRGIFRHFTAHRTALAAIRSFYVRNVVTVKRPAVTRFSHVVNVSAPGTTCGVNDLIGGNCIRGVRSAASHHRCFLHPARGCVSCCDVDCSCLRAIVRHIHGHFPTRSYSGVRRVLSIVDARLVPRLSVLTGYHRPRTPRSRRWGATQQGPPTVPKTFSLSCGDRTRPPHQGKATTTS